MDTPTAPLTENQNTAQSSIEQKVASILQFTKNYAHAAAIKNENDKVASLLQFAEYFAENGNFESALSHVQQAYKARIDDSRIPPVEWKIREMMNAQNMPGVQGETPVPIEQESSHVQQVNQLLTEAEIFFEEEKYEKAVQLLEQAFAMDPLNEALSALNGKILVHFASQADPMTTLLEKAYLLRKRYQFTEALEFVRQAYVVDPLNDGIRTLEEQIINEMNEIHRSIQSHLFTARKYIAVKQFPEARHELRTAYLVSPRDEKVRAVELQLDEIETSLANQ